MNVQIIASLQKIFFIVHLLSAILHSVYAVQKGMTTGISIATAM